MKYFFRALPILEYDPETKQVELPLDEDTNTGYTNFQACKFIPEDFDLLAQFFTAANLHATGKIETKDLPEDFEVY